KTGIHHLKPSQRLGYIHPSGTGFSGYRQAQGKRPRLGFGRSGGKEDCDEISSAAIDENEIHNIFVRILGSDLENLVYHLVTCFILFYSGQLKGVCHLLNSLHLVEAKFKAGCGQSLLEDFELPNTSMSVRLRKEWEELTSSPTVAKKLSEMRIFIGHYHNILHQ
ncbi:unnamed protein product, partial [Protopolystoma xenopodis]